MTNPFVSELNGKHALTPSASELRIAELESENNRLRGDLVELQKAFDIERAVVISHMIADLPKTEEEFLRLAREGQSFRELLDEVGFTRELVEKP